ncbi:MAG TPA: PEP/pyruvate-binding domain-containing protein [Solirubrobacteraceae bacterium]
MSDREEAVSILWLGEEGCNATDRVGGKAAHLSRLFAHTRVPPGFCVAASMDDLEGGSETDGPPPALAERIAASYAELCERTGHEDVPVAVRSSALDEDSADSSFAGQHETFLNVSGADAVVDAVKHCWASARTERVLEYRRSRGLPPPRGPIPVLVQQLVMADASAVVFSVDPVTAERTHVVINVSWGLGESVVAGSVNPDTHHVSRPGLEIVERHVASKQKMTVAVPGGTDEVEVPFVLRDAPAAEDEQVVAMARAALELEEHFGWPVDVECCWAEGRLYILQCRAVTALARPDATKEEVPSGR